jgi:hypothetical protein
MGISATSWDQSCTHVYPPRYQSTYYKYVGPSSVCPGSFQPRRIGSSSWRPEASGNQAFYSSSKYMEWAACETMCNSHIRLHISPFYHSWIHDIFQLPMCDNLERISSSSSMQGSCGLKIGGADGKASCMMSTIPGSRRTSTQLSDRQRRRSLRWAQA